MRKFDNEESQFATAIESTEVKKLSIMQRMLPWILRADDKQPPKGFEKFFKRKDS